MGVDRLRVIIEKKLYVLETFYELLVVIVFADGSRWPASKTGRGVCNKLS